MATLNNYRVTPATWADRVVQFRMPRIGLYIERCHFRFGHPYRFGIAFFVQFAAHRLARLGRGGGDQFDDREAADERLAAPCLGDVAEHAMLDLVPFRCPRWIMAYLQDQPGFIGQLLQFEFPQPHPRPV
jgi:hypothetical protein